MQRRELSTRVDRASFSILLLQDLAIVPILILVGAFGDHGGGSLLEALTIGFRIATTTIYVLGRIVLRPLFRLAASARAPEFFVAITLLTAIGASVATGAAGLSLALGAFLAGLLLSETEFRHRSRWISSPSRGLLMGLFFLTIGMEINLAILADSGVLIIASVFGLFVLKAVLITGMGRAVGLPFSCAAHAGILLGQAGEFGLLVVGLSMASGIIAPEPGQFLLVVAALLMMLTPGLAILGAHLSIHLERNSVAPSLSAAPDEIAEMGGHVLIAGYGRVGRAVAELLREERINYVALDIDTAMVSHQRARNEPIFFGDGRRADVLAKLGADRASAIVLTLDQERQAEEAVRDIRAHWPDVPIYARSRALEHAAELEAAGATRTIPEIAESSLQMGAFVLTGLGVPSDAVNTLCERNYEGL